MPAGPRSLRTVSLAIRIGPYELAGRAVLAPMAGVTDHPFRRLCLDHGASLAATEMTTSDTKLWGSPKSRSRLTFDAGDGLKVIQIAGSEPAQMAEAARRAADLGAQIVDINMGCPAKKVCKKLAGSALLRDENLVKKILEAVVSSVSVPVTLKMRTGWDANHRNGVRVARIAAQSGVCAIAVHGRTRACNYKEPAEYRTIKAIKAAVCIPVFANGDIDTPQRAAYILKNTHADGIMLGRSARGQPWIFFQVNEYLSKKNFVSMPSLSKRRDMILLHLDAMYRLYGEEKGVRVARKHLAWYCQHLAGTEEFRYRALRSTSTSDQMRLTKSFFDCRLSEDDKTSGSYSALGASRQWQNRERNATEFTKNL